MTRTLLIGLGILGALFVVGCQTEATPDDAKKPENQMKGGMVPEGGAVNPDQKASPPAESPK